MGLCIASELFQEAFTTQLADLQNIKVAIDDVLVYGADQDEHDEALHALLQRLIDIGLTCKLDKCKFNQRSVEFFGMEISADGIKPRTEKLTDFKNAKAPKNAKELRSFLGLATYFTTRIQHLSETSECLRALLKQNTQYKWIAEQESDFNKIKTDLITHALAHFDITRQTELWVDAGPEGVSAFIIQIDSHNVRHLVACASRTFTKAEKNYSQVEKESFACVWSILHFHIYLFGKFTTHDK